MPDIRSAQIYAFYLFDIAETANLGAIPDLIGGPTIPARLVPKSPMPAYVQYDKPPISFDGDLIGIPDIAGFRPRFRVYDYGVISLALSRPYDDGSWEGLVVLGQDLIENEELGRLAEVHCRAVVNRLEPALSGLRQEFLKLKTLDEIYGSTVEQSSISRGHFLELVVVLILVLELVLLLLGVMS